MSELVASEIWSELKRYVNTVDRAEAAETIVAILIDHDSTVDNIKDAFKDKDITKALKGYAEQHFQEEEYEENDDEDHNPEDWN